MRAAWLVAAGLTACGDDAKPTTYTHADPAFTIDLPPGFHAIEDPERVDGLLRARA